MKPLASLLLLTACGTGDTDAPRAIESAQVVVTIAPQYEAPPFILDRPESIVGLLSVEIAADGAATGSLSIPGARASLTAVTGFAIDGELTLDPGEIYAHPSGRLEWESFTLTAGEQGLVDSTGSAAGEWEGFAGDVIDSSSFSAEITAAADLSGESFGLLPPDTRPLQALLPTDVIRVALGEPADAASASAIRILADGVPVGGTLTPLADPIHGLVTGLSLRASGFWAFDTVLTADPGRLADPNDNPMMWQGDELRVVVDPGSLTGNLGFESGTTGWITAGGVDITAAFGGVAPAEGTSQMVVRQESVAAGYFDVPATATSLSLSAGLFSEIGELDRDRTAVVALHRENGERIVVFDAYDEREAGATCECKGGLHHLIPPVRKSVDLSAFRGERLFLTAQVRSSYFIGVNYFALVLDDLRID